MKTIKIAHLYYDLMNLYGENGNVRALQKYLSKSFNVKVFNLTVDDEIDFDKYDIFYIGSGNNESFNIVLEDIKKYKDKIKDAINNKFFITTGNSINLFGKYYINKRKKTECLNLLKYSSKEKKKRIVGEQILKFKHSKHEIIGFFNRGSKLIKIKEKMLFSVIEGYGTLEGINYKHFYGTYLLGPLLIRNPYFTEYLVKQICKKYDTEYIKVNNDMEVKAYEEYRYNFLKK